jgi:hypothetical protein
MSAAAEPFDDQQAKVEAALRRFAISEPPSTKAIPYSFLIPAISRELVWEARRAPPTVPREKATQDFNALKKKAAKAMASLRSDPSLAVEFPLEDRIAIVRIAHLEVNLSDQRRAPRKDAAARVARLLALHCEGLTGSHPTRITPVRDGTAQPSNGRFIEMLAEVYEALRIQASADNQARSAIKAMEKYRSKSDD